MSSDNYCMRIAINKSILKERSNGAGQERTVYLKGGTEYQIQLFNDTPGNIAAEIFIDGESLGNCVVLKPGERVWLERYLDNARKFLFETYEVEAGNERVDQAIASNGEVKVKFYRERPRRRNPIRLANTPNSWNDNILFNKPIESTYDGFYRSCEPGVLKSNAVFSSCSTTMGCCDSQPACLSAGVAEFGASIADTAASTITTKETGRTGEGSVSDQEFKSVDMDFESYSFRTEKVRILPYSQKPFYKEDVEKIYCTQCGTKLSPKFKFCPKCGNKI